MSARRGLYPMAAAVALAALSPQAAVAQCFINTNIYDTCAGKTYDSVDAYRDCYESYYNMVIPMYQQVANCARTTGTASIIDKVLGQAETQALADLKQTAVDVKTTVDSALAPCFRELRDITGLLDPYIKNEASATDLDPFRREHYGPDHFAYFADAILALQNLSLGCTPIVVQVKKALAAFDAIDKTAPDLCPWLRDNLPYQLVVDAIAPIPRPARIDPNIDMRGYFNFTFRSMTCSDGSGGCYMATAEGGSELVRLHGFVFENKVMIGAIAGALAGTIYAIATGASVGSAAGGPIGAAVMAVVIAAISFVEWLVGRHEIDELEDYVDAKEDELDRAIAGAKISEPDFIAMRDRHCADRVPITENAIKSVVDQVDSPGHLRKMDGFFDAVDAQVEWYNDLFSWAVDDESGPSFLDLIAQDAVLAKREAFYQSIRQARTSQEVGAQRSEVATLQGSISLLTCSSTATPSQKRSTKTLLRRKIGQFNQLCEDVTRTLERATPVIPYGGETGSDVVCSYDGFLTNVRKLAIDPGVGTAARGTVYDSNGVVVATIPDFSSDTSWPDRTELPGFRCASPMGLPFGTTASNRLQPGQYELALVNSIAGFTEQDEASMRAFMKDTDGYVRRKEMTCLRVIDNPAYTIPRTATSCGIPTTF